MYAIIAIGGRQLKVHEGDTIRVERLPGEVGEAVTLKEVLLVHDSDGTVTIGSPTIEGASATGHIVAHGRGKKTIVFKHKRRKGYRRKQGHRQPYTDLKISGIDLKASAPQPPKRAAEAKQLKEAAAAPSKAEE
ncbi:MAG: 50S ribosomal protein L21 [Nitrospinota bacterium]